MNLNSGVDILEKKSLFLPLPSIFLIPLFLPYLLQRFLFIQVCSIAINGARCQNFVIFNTYIDKSNQTIQKQRINKLEKGKR